MFFATPLLLAILQTLIFAQITLCFPVSSGVFFVILKGNTLYCYECVCVCVCRISIIQLEFFGAVDVDIRGPLATTERGSSDVLRRECNRQRRHPDLGFAPSIKMSLKQVFEKASTTCSLLASYITKQPLCVCV